MQILSECVNELINSQFDGDKSILKRYLLSNEVSFNFKK